MRKPPFLLMAALFFVATSCATHNPIVPPDLDNDLAAQQARQVKDGIAVMALPVHSKSALSAHFDEDLIHEGVLPIQVDIDNRSGSPCAIEIGRTALFNADGESFPPLNLKEISWEASHSYAYAIPWGIGFGLIGALPSMINVAMVNEKIEKDYDNCMLKDAAMVDGASTTGTLFFPIDDDIASLDEWFFSLGLTRDGQAVDFVFDLHGAVEQPRVERQEKTERVGYP